MRVHPDFADVRHEIAGFGSLDGPGATRHHSAQQEIRDEGVKYDVQCDNCGATNGVIVSWGEFIYGAEGQVPPGWAPMPQLGRFHPNVGCWNCRYVLAVTFTPDDCQRQVKSGLMGGKMQPQQVAQMQQQIRGMAQR